MKRGTYAILGVLGLAWIATTSFAQLGNNIVIDGNFDDWADIPVAISDPKDMSDANINGDYKEIKVASTETTLYVLQTVYGEAAPNDDFRYYYHVLIDADNNPDTGFRNDMYEDVPTGVVDVIGADFYLQIGRRAGADDGIAAVHAESDTEIFQNFAWAHAGDSMELAVDWSVLVPPAGFELGPLFAKGDTIRIAAFQEGNADGWGPIDWTEAADHVVATPLLAAAVDPAGKLAATWGALKARGAR